MLHIDVIDVILALLAFLALMIGCFWWAHRMTRRWFDRQDQLLSDYLDPTPRGHDRRR